MTRALLLFLCIALVGCGSTDEEPSGTYAMYLNTDLLGAVEVTFIKGRCLGRLAIRPAGDAPQAALIAVAQAVASDIALDGSAPASDQALVGLVPTAPLSGSLAGWLEDDADQISGPWLETGTAFDWINGSGGPFDDNGFEAVAGERYLQDSEGWSLDLEIVNLGSTVGAQAAMSGAGWDAGSLYE